MTTSRACQEGCTCGRHSRSGNFTKGRPTLKKWHENPENHALFIQRMNDPARCAKISTAATGRKPSQESIQLSASKRTGIKLPPRSDAYRAELSKRMKKRWKDPVQARSFAHWARASKLEFKVREELDARGIEYEVDQTVAGFLPDLVVEDLIIEVNGSYWHGSEASQARDAMKEAAYRDAGYRVAWIWDYEINDDIKLAVDTALGRG